MEEKQTRIRFLLYGVILGMLLMGITVLITLIVSRQQAEQMEQQVTEDADLVYLDKNAVINKDVLAKMGVLIDIINNRFYFDGGTPKRLQDGIYKGILKSLGDVYSEYYTEEELSEELRQTEGVYYGIGAYVALDSETGYIRIAEVMEDSPAQRADLHNDDVIIKIDETDVYGMSLSEATSLMKGDNGTEVKLLIGREDSEVLEVTVVRGPVPNLTVNYGWTEAIGYIKITEFDGVTPDQFAEALAVLKEKQMQGIILDLRGNPGGNLDSVVEIAKMILPKGLIVYTEDKYGERQEYYCEGDKKIDIPVAVLVNKATASASEILSGAMQDHGVGYLIGKTTYGKGIVQAVISLRDKTALKITTSAYFTPNGRNIHGKGIEPDLEVEFDSAAYYENGYDSQLEAAFSYLEDLLGIEPEEIEEEPDEE